MKELEEQVQAAGARTLNAAAQPGASVAETAAADALGAGDTLPAEALLGRQERKEAAQIGTPGADDERQRRWAAQLARERSALAMGHDVRAALVAYQRAAEHEPDHASTRFFIGDLHRRLGDVNRAMQAYREALSIAERLTARDPANPRWQRDFSVSQNRIGDALVSTGDSAGALAAYLKDLAIRETLAASDPADIQWQCDVSGLCGGLGGLTQVLSEEVRRAYLLRGRRILLRLKKEGRLLRSLDDIKSFDRALRALRAAPTK